MKTLKAIFGDANIRSRVLFIIFILVITRVLATIPIPGVGTTNLANFLAKEGNGFFSMLNIFSGGGLSAFSFVMIGVGAYITSSIIMQLGTVLSPRLKEMYHEEGEAGRKRFVQYGRMLSLPLAMLQGFALISLLSRQHAIETLSGAAMLSNVLIVSAGAMLMMWLGEQINERGIGNGVSLIIFAGIVANLPTKLAQYFLTFDVSQIPTLVGILVLTLVVIAGIVFITEAERPVAVTYAKQARLGASSGVGASTYIPLRLNQAGVIPIIFAVSVLIFPQMLGQLLATSSMETLASFARTVNSLISNQWIYGISYFLLVVVFTYFYTAVMFDPEKTSDNLQKNGAFVPGYRPGIATAEYIGGVLSRITLFGAVFLGLVAVLPVIVSGVTGNTTLSIGGTSLLIAISVVLDLIKKVEAQLSMREY